MPLAPEIPPARPTLCDVISVRGIETWFETDRFTLASPLPRGGSSQVSLVWSASLGQASFYMSLAEYGNAPWDHVMNRFLFAPGIACLLCASSAFAQSSEETANAAIAQNFQYMNHPPAPPAPASSATETHGMHGHRHRQSSADSDSTQSASNQQ